jgi:hypothetical protein
LRATAATVRRAAAWTPPPTIPPKIGTSFVTFTTPRDPAFVRRRKPILRIDRNQYMPRDTTYRGATTAL